MIDIKPEYLGYFIGPDELRAVYDPPLDSPCLVCGEPYVEETVRTISLMPENCGMSMFYRLHRKCHDYLTLDEELKLDNTVIGVLLDWTS